jgi:hypothetical protein
MQVTQASTRNMSPSGSDAISTLGYQDPAGDVLGLIKEENYYSTKELLLFLAGVRSTQNWILRRLDQWGQNMRLVEKFIDLVDKQTCC